MTCEVRCARSGMRIQPMGVGGGVDLTVCLCDVAHLVRAVTFTVLSKVCVQSFASFQSLPGF